ncbi:MAG: ATP-dependent helicase [Bacteroidota bacterium]|nr:ATP-dependent helicase [Bacteroidota bacterium]
MRWDEGLEGPAKRIAELDHTPIRVLAGPGTGKTFALKRRVARLLQDGVRADQILVCTFTRMAAQDLKNELADLGVDSVEEVRSETLHALCFRLLGQAEVFKITGRNPRPLLKFEERFLLKDLNREIFGNTNKRKRHLQASNAAWARLQTEDPGWPTDPVDQVFQRDLDAWLRFHDAMLIGELVPESLKFLRENPASPHRGTFEHILIDEYQDLNRAEQELLDLLAKEGQLLVVGDEDQSIYSFKFAHPDGIATFDRSHPGTVSLELEECRRCPKHVVELANKLISNNQNRTPRSLKSRSENSYGKVRVLQWNSIRDEAEGIAKLIHDQIQRHGIEPGQVIILAPRRQIGYAIRDAFSAIGLPAHSFFQEEALKTGEEPTKYAAQEAFTILTLLANPYDRVALRCWCGFGSPSLRRGAWERLRNHCLDRGQIPYTALEHLELGKVAVPYTGPLVERFQELKRRLEEFKNLRGQALINALFPENEEWASPLRDLVSILEEDEFDAKVLHEELRIQITQPELPKDVDYIRIMSLHKSKGLTADLVVVAGCVEGLVPRLNMTMGTPDEMAALEEQRRLFYVAITRTRQILVLSSLNHLPRKLVHQMGMEVRNQWRNNQEAIASRFLYELGPSRPRAVSGTAFLERELL